MAVFMLCHAHYVLMCYLREYTLWAARAHLIAVRQNAKAQLFPSKALYGTTLMPWNF